MVLAGNAVQDRERASRASVTTVLLTLLQDPAGAPRSPVRGHARVRSASTTTNRSGCSSAIRRYASDTFAWKSCPRPRSGRVPRANGAVRPPVPVQQENEVGEQPLCRPHVEREHVLLTWAARGALIGQRRIDVPIGEHDLARGQGRPDHRRHVLGTARREQQGLRLRLDVSCVVREEQRAWSSSPIGVPPVPESPTPRRPATRAIPWPVGSASPCPIRRLERHEQTVRRWALELGDQPQGLRLPALRTFGAGSGSGRRRAARRSPRSSTRSASRTGRTSARPASGYAHRSRRR